MGDQEEVTAIDQGQEKAHGTEEIEKKTGVRKWFKRSTSAGKQKSTDTGTKPRSRSVFAFLSKLGKKKDKKKPQSETVDDVDKIGVETDQDETPEAAEATPTSDQPFPYPECPPDDLFDEEEDVVEGPSKAEMEFRQYMTNIKMDWLEFGNSLGMGDQEVMKIIEEADVVPKASTKIQTGMPNPKVVAEEEDAKIKDLVEKAPALALGSVGPDFECFPILPLGVPGNTSECASLAFMTLEGSLNESKEAGLDSAGSIKYGKVLTSYESDQGSEFPMSQTTNAIEKGCSMSNCCSISSFHSTMAPDSVSFFADAVQNIDTLPADTGNTLLISVNVEESVTMNARDTQQMEDGTSKQCSIIKLKSAISGESKTAVPEESKMAIPQESKMAIPQESKMAIPEEIAAVTAKQFCNTSLLSAMEGESTTAIPEESK